MFIQCSTFKIWSCFLECIEEIPINCPTVSLANTYHPMIACQLASCLRRSKFVATHQVFSPLDSNFSTVEPWEPNGEIDIRSLLASANAPDRGSTSS